MPDGIEAVTVKVMRHITEIAAEQWDACAGAGNPFVSHAFLAVLEESGSVRAGAGWAPQHLVVEDAAGKVVACAPLYLKNHSYGEYVFDWSWADAYRKAGGLYYPKFQVAVPFTPVTGPRLLVPAGPRAGERRDVLIAAMLDLAKRHKVSSLHVTFPTLEECDAFRRHGFLIRQGVQYHWFNHGYGSFSDFLGTLSSRKRKGIRKERERVTEQGIVLHTLTGAALKPEHWQAFYRFYLDTVDRKWANAYLDERFFTLLGERMADRAVLVMAQKDGCWVAGALNLLGKDALYGRNWGAQGEFRFLHFEACYYRAIDFAIKKGLARVEAGAQGEHKVQRGYMPVSTWSAHWIADRRFHAAIADFLRREEGLVRCSMAELAESAPFRKEPQA